MTFAKQCVTAVALLAFAACGREVRGQTTLLDTEHSTQQQSPSSAPEIAPSPSSTNPVLTSPAALFDFKDSDIKFNLQSLMNTLRDQRHEGWVLAAYPDPNTHRPLIGAGFSLDVAATVHPQPDPLNTHAFLEPSSVQLWQAAGLDPDLLQKILDRFDRDSQLWTTRQFRRKIRTHTLTPELTEEEATRLLRISTIQAVYNAKAYCRNFDQLTGPQQMALSQLVFQMGVNLEEFVQFLGAINGDGYQNVSLNNSDAATDPGYWKTVQTTLIDSQWAHRYRDRASTVIAMFDPNYADDPIAAERRVDAVLRPPKHHHRQSAHVVRTSGKTHIAKSSAHAATTRKRKSA